MLQKSILSVIRFEVKNKLKFSQSFSQVQVAHPVNYNRPINYINASYPGFVGGTVNYHGGYVTGLAPPPYGHYPHHYGPGYVGGTSNFNAGVVSGTGGFDTGTGGFNTGGDNTGTGGVDIGVGGAGDYGGGFDIGGGGGDYGGGFDSGGGGD